MEISSEIGQASIGGITQPIIGQKKVDLGDIRLRDGDPASSAASWTTADPLPQRHPGLAQIPILKYLFGQTTTDHSQDETVFAITPDVNRGSDINEANAAPHRHRHGKHDHAAPT